MDAKAIRRREIDGLYDLASMYLQATNRILGSGAEDEGSIRVAIDAGYNAIELCAKAFLLSRLDTLPKSHGGVKTLFSDHFVKRGVLPRDFGGKFSRCLQNRHEARNDPGAEVSREQADLVSGFAGEVLDSLKKYLVGLQPRGRVLTLNESHYGRQHALRKEELFVSLQEA